VSNKKDYEDIIKGIGFMKKYKRNIMIKVAGVISELIITFIPIYLISSLLLFPPLIFKDFIKFTGLTILVIVIVNIIFYIIAAIAKIFIKTAYIITSDSLITQINNEVHSTIYLKDVYYLT
jgi:cellulose synthase/poly-beta-1,6-N-acetylglucosamine synthase-like glycosyltransferase